MLQSVHEESYYTLCECVGVYRIEYPIFSEQFETVECSEPKNLVRNGLKRFQIIENYFKWLKIISNDWKLFQMIFKTVLYNFKNNLK